MKEKRQSLKRMESNPAGTSRSKVTGRPGKAGKCQFNKSINIKLNQKTNDKSESTHKQILATQIRKLEKELKRKGEIETMDPNEAREIQLKAERDYQDKIFF